MSKDIKPFLIHILQEVEYLQQKSKGLEFEKFVKDETLKRSFLRSLEVIGEAAKNVSSGFRKKYPEIEWKKMAGLRDVLIHHYFGVDYKSVWDIVKNRIPKLKKQIDNILNGIK